MHTKIEIAEPTDFLSLILKYLIVAQHLSG